VKIPMMIVTGHIPIRKGVIPTLGFATFFFGERVVLSTTWKETVCTENRKPEALCRPIGTLGFLSRHSRSNPVSSRKQKQQISVNPSRPTVHQFRVEFWPIDLPLSSSGRGLSCRPPGKKRYVQKIKAFTVESSFLEETETTDKRQPQQTDRPPELNRNSSGRGLSCRPPGKKRYVQKIENLRLCAVP
jgi:hypothetical protein